MRRHPSRGRASEGRLEGRKGGREEEGSARKIRGQRSSEREKRQVEGEGGNPGKAELDAGLRIVEFILQ